MKSLRLLVLILCASTFAAAGDREFKGLVHSFETTYGVHHMHIPLLGVALFIARPAGAHGLQLAVFENFHAPTDSVDVRRVVESALGPGWYPFVRVHEKGETSGETTLVYTNPEANRMRMIIVSLESSEATLVKLDLNDRDMKKWLKEPGEEAEGRHHHEIY